MRVPVSPLTLFEPRSLRDALSMLRDFPGTTPLAGGTDLYVGLNLGTEKRRRFLNLWELESLRRISVSGRILSIGALSTYTQLSRSPAVRSRIPILAAAAREIGGAQIQNRGTIGGNVVNASPAGDTLPVLAVADAVLLLGSASGRRRVPFSAFNTGYRSTVLRPDELLLAVEIPALDGKAWFRKVGTRAAQAISKVVMAGVRGARPRLAVGSVGPTVLRLPRTEAALAAGAPIDSARAALLAEIHPIDDVRSTAEYRRRVSANLLEQFWRETA